jgi:hypothetical protein
MLGHGPFTTLHEILSSNLWSLALVVAVSVLALRELRDALLARAGAGRAGGVWLLMADAGPGHLPPTYATPLLYLHTLVGKLYLGLLLVAVALGRRAGGCGRTASAATRLRVPTTARRAGAPLRRFRLRVRHADADRRRGVGAGRLGPLLGLGPAGVLGLRELARAGRGAARARHAAARRPPCSGLWLAGVFLLAFLTFFGVPFISTAPHKGVV